MNEPGFELHPLAARDITEIWEFIFEDNAAAARRVHEAILEAIRTPVIPEQAVEQIRRAAELLHIRPYARKAGPRAVNGRNSLVSLAPARPARAKSTQTRHASLPSGRDVRYRTSNFAAGESNAVE
jgi:plasmid stabilization system protein ParE